MTSVVDSIHSQSGPTIADISFRYFAENTPDLIEILDLQGKRIFLNPAYTTIFPTLELMIGTSPFEDVNLVNPDKLRDMFVNVVQYGKTLYTQYERILPDGNSRYFECRAIALPPDQNDHQQATVLMISRDITERVQFNELLSRYATQVKVAQEIGEMGSWEFDFTSETLQISERFARIFGLAPQTAELSRDELFVLIHPDDRERIANVRSQLQGDNIVYDAQYRIIRPDNQVRVVHSRWGLERDTAGQLYRTIGFCEDITDRLNAEKKALATEEHFQLLVTNAQDMAIFLLDLDGKVMSWNQGAERLYGYNSSEVIDKYYSCFFMPGTDDVDMLSSRLQAAVRSGKLESEGWRVRKDGERFWGRIIVTPFFDRTGNHIGYLKLTHDMTKQKCIEDILRSQADRLRDNARRLVELQESERQHLARELHDLVGPNLTALGINLQLINSSLVADKNSKVPDILKDSVNYVHATVDTIRYIIGELRPHALDDFGLRAALRSHVDQFMKLTGIKVSLEESNAPDDMPELIKMSLFRITQEALNNIARHAQATAAEIYLEYEQQKISLTIKDNGVGFEMEMNRQDTDKPSQRIGLSIIRERAEAIGASFEIETTPGQGVQLRLQCNL